MNDHDSGPRLRRRPRRVLRLPGYDYTTAGGYFVTICTRGRLDCLAVIKDATSCPTAAGRVVEDVWNGLPDRFGVAPDQFIVMPNHVHGIVQITGESVSLGEIVRSFKAATTRMIRQAGMTDFAWQASYYEHIIRNEHELERIRNYIVSNPLMWNDDPENPSRLNSGGLSTIEPPWAR